MKSIPDEYKKA